MALTGAGLLMCLHSCFCLFPSVAAHGRRAHLKDASARLAAVSQLLRQHGAEAEAAEAARVAAKAGVVATAGQ